MNKDLGWMSYYRATSFLKVENKNKERIEGEKLDDTVWKKIIQVNLGQWYSNFLFFVLAQ